MKKLLILIMLLALTMGSLSMAIAAENVGTVTGTTYSVYNNPTVPIVTPVKPAKPVIKGRAVVGGVVYSVYGDTLTVQKFLGKKKSKKFTFTTNAKTKIIWNKKALKADNVVIQKGSRVLVKGWLLSNGKLTAVEIKVLKGKVLLKKKVIVKKPVLLKKQVNVKKQVVVKKQVIDNKVVTVKTEIKTTIKKSGDQIIIKNETTTIKPVEKAKPVKAPYKKG